jgi:hypothetical protein
MTIFIKTDAAFLAAQWEEAKMEEKAATDRRRDIEDQLVECLGIPKQMDGTKNEEAGIYEIKITSRLDRKVNTDKLQTLAEEAGLTEHLSSLFRWKPEINMAAWKSAHESITGPLLGAITTTASRPSFSITKKDD